MHTQEEIKNILERHFKEISDVYGIEMAFLCGSWARGFPKKFPDVATAVVFSEEDFSIFGIRWQWEVAEKNIKECEQKNLSGLAIQGNRLAHSVAKPQPKIEHRLRRLNRFTRYLNFRWQAIKMYHGNKDAVLKLIQLILELEKKKKDVKRRK